MQSFFVKLMLILIGFRVSMLVKDTSNYLLLSITANKLYPHI